MANGKWQMANGKWQMANGKWQMANQNSTSAMTCKLYDVLSRLLDFQAQKM